ncbi:MAG: hypothetical protein KGD58_18350 [Candidatus Lokiarchaeota archaeon]|nr:hypothetical protein [Candidatus Lokiarchaeota archaeon]
MKDNFDAIRGFFRERLGKDEKKIEKHRGHDLIIKLAISEVKPSFKMNILFECVDCKVIWDHTIYSNKHAIMGIYGTVDWFFSKLDENSRFLNNVSSGVYKIIKSLNDADRTLKKASKRRTEQMYFRRREKPNIQELLNKYDKEESRIFRDEGYIPETIECEICKNFDSKKQFCNIYDCYPFDYEIPVEDYCIEFFLDRNKEEERKKNYLKFTM